jgi:hypothetical protein
MRTDMADLGSEETARMDVVYEKERVTIHPTQYGSGRISGKLRLYLQLESLFLVSISTSFNQLLVVGRLVVSYIHDTTIGLEIAVDAHTAAELPSLFNFNRCEVP